MNDGRENLTWSVSCRCGDFFDNYSRARSCVLDLKNNRSAIPDEISRCRGPLAPVASEQDKLVRLARNILSYSTIFRFIQRTVKTSGIIISLLKEDYIVSYDRKPDPRFNDYLLARPSCCAFK